MNKLLELFTNVDGRASTTGFIQFFGFLVMAGVLIYAVYLDRSTVTDLFFYFACFCGGSAATKGNQKNRLPVKPMLSQNKRIDQGGFDEYADYFSGARNFRAIGCVCDV